MDEFKDKRHLVMFKTNVGEVFVGTNDLEELSNQDWFREFLNLRASVRQQSYPVSPQQVPPVQRMPPQQPQMRQPGGIPPRRVPQGPAFSELNPDTMKEEIWATMTPEQQREWMSFYGIQ
jgi:hypothetical protein